MVSFAKQIQKNKIILLLIDFRKYKPEFKLFSVPFDMSVEECPNFCQLELLDLQSDMNLKNAYQNNDLLTFYKNYLQGSFPNTEKNAKKWLHFLSAHIVVNNSS